MHILIIYNPKSGTASAIEGIKKAFKAEGETPEFLAITDPSLRRKAKAFATRRHAVLVAAGGDGTVNCVATLAVESHSRMGVIPTGTLNHFAKDAAIPLKMEDAVAAIVHGKTIRVDSASVKNRVFVNNSSIGLYPQSLRLRKKFREIIGNIPAAFVGLASVIARPRRYRLELTVDGKKMVRRTPFVFVGNNPYAINPKGLFVRSELTRGTLAIYVVRAQNPWQIIRMAAHAIFTRKRRTPDFDILYAQRCTIRSRHSKLHVALDGEVAHLQTPLTYAVLPKSLRVIVPR
ncbi:MAG TPA: diacylglycerol kinase family protein [Candidatus Saccharimonadales bacterium]|nr:diacylglycerol kinase family protein [Candidatus Saccharimonadales bacterium]